MKYRSKEIFKNYIKLKIPLILEVESQGFLGVIGSLLLGVIALMIVYTIL